MQLTFDFVSFYAVPYIETGLLPTRSSYFIGEKAQFNGCSFSTHFIQDLSLFILKDDGTVVKNVSLETEASITWSATTNKFAAILNLASINFSNSNFTGAYTCMLKIQLNVGQDYISQFSRSAPVTSKSKVVFFLLT